MIDPHVQLDLIASSPSEREPLDEEEQQFLQEFGGAKLVRARDLVKTAVSADDSSYACVRVYTLLPDT